MKDGWLDIENDELDAEVFDYITGQGDLAELKFCRYEHHGGIPRCTKCYLYESYDDYEEDDPFTHECRFVLLRGPTNKFCELQPRNYYDIVEHLILEGAKQ